jgi:glutamate--cysteine ligase
MENTLSRENRSSVPFPSSKPSSDPAGIQSWVASSREAQKLKKEFAEKLKGAHRSTRDWVEVQQSRAPAPFYSSVDLRDAGFKIAPVDSNLYPAGFNNICPEDLRTSPPLVRRELIAAVNRAGAQSECRKVLIVPEAHTSNRYYVENLTYLQQLLKDAEFEVKVGWFGPIPEEVQTSDGHVRLVSVTERELIAVPFEVQVDGLLVTRDGFVPDVVLLNNDFSSGYPELLDRVAQPILPSHELGWHTRRKSDHFLHYNALATEFAQLVGVDPWLITVDTEAVDQVNFNEDQGLDRVAESVARVLDRTRNAYRERKIEREPFVFVKNNSGTYGMGILVVRSPEEVLQLNRRAKNKMSVGKNRLPILSLAVQEGIPTSTLVDRLAAEPVIYLTGPELIGGFLRTNTERGVEDNLNSQGMAFRKLCMADLRSALQEQDDPELAAEATIPQLEMVYGSIARISALAAGRELAAVLGTGSHA